MSCGSISAQGSCTGTIKPIGCCPHNLYSPFESGINIFGRQIGAGWRGVMSFGSGGGGGGGGSTGGSSSFGGGAIDIDDGGGDDGWIDGDFSVGGDGIKIGDGGNCIVYGAEVTLYNGVRIPIERLRVGDQLASIVLEAMQRDAVDGQYHLHEKQIGREVAPGRVESIRHGWHDGYYTINGVISATFEHPFLIRRGSYYGFSPAESLLNGDFIQSESGETEITTIVKVDSSVRTVSLFVPGLNTFMAAGLWVHNAKYEGPPSGGDLGSTIEPDGKSSGGVGSF